MVQLKDRKNVRFVGEVPDIEVAFRVIDWVVQAGMVPGMGRTSLESLFSGGGSIVPGTMEENIEGLDLPENFQERMLFYPVRDLKALTNIFVQTANVRFTERKFESNVPQYIEKFIKFINSTRGWE
jgi:hypothetical protein